eukprot:TRINITY_DN684_c0_g1_i6.p1 TRINITY_DN684_c0_g1~~TRINITY_DN684_c0_g1_i6.p1  ORF type:complete len:295 (+),score=34.35 TRINITY_DN684_c0_g1_i6:43-885(+)
MIEEEEFQGGTSRIDDPLDPRLEGVDYDLLSKHVIFPKRLPDSTEVGFEQQELHLLLLLSSSCDHFYEDCPKSVETIREWEKVQLDFEPTQVNKYIQNLRVGDSAVFYMRAQNAGLMFTITYNKVLAYSFPISAPNNLIYKNEGHIFVKYPTAAVKVKRSELFNSKIFAKQIYNLATTPIGDALPTSSKGGTEFPEERDVANPRFVSEFLLGSLLDDSSEEPTKRELIHVVKKVKDAVVWKDCLSPFRRSPLYNMAKIVLQLSLVNEFPDNPDMAHFLYR